MKYEKCKQCGSIIIKRYNQRTKEESLILYQQNRFCSSDCLFRFKVIVRHKKMRERGVRVPGEFWDRYSHEKYRKRKDQKK